MHDRGLKQFCSVLGKGPKGYKYISRFFDAAMDKIGQILKDDKMAAISNANALELRTTKSSAHLHPICLPFCHLDGVFNRS
jgi:hypothetical protein